MERLHYVCHVRLNALSTFVIWYEDERDGFVRSPASRLLMADSREALLSAAVKLGLTLEPNETAEYDFDRLQAWCINPAAEAIVYTAFLNAWNFLDDLAGLHANPDSHYARTSRLASENYDKLFWGNNLPALTPPGERFEPSWSAEELAEIRDVYQVGLGLLAKELFGNGIGMITPPELIDGARVLRYATIPPDAASRDTIICYVESPNRGPPAGLAICQYDGESRFYLFYCSPAWEVLVDTYHDSLQQAMHEAEFEFRGIVNAWRDLD